MLAPGSSGPFIVTFSCGHSVFVRAVRVCGRRGLAEARAEAPAGAGAGAGAGWWRFGRAGNQSGEPARARFGELAIYGIAEEARTLIYNVSIFPKLTLALRFRLAARVGWARVEPTDSRQE